jgi:hypothetical protein
MVYIPECKQQELSNNTLRYQILHTLNWAVVLLLSESHAIINDLDVILHGFMSQITYTTVVRVKLLSKLTFHARLFTCLTRKTVV